MPTALQFPTTDKSPWITTPPCRLHLHSQLILLFYKMPQNALRYSGNPLCLLPCSFFRTADNSSHSPGIRHPQLFMCFPKYFEILSDLPRILCNLLLWKFLRTCIMVNSIRLVIFVDIPCHCHFESLDSICMRMPPIIS